MANIFDVYKYSYGIQIQVKRPLNDLDGLGVQQDGGNWIGFDGILVDQERTRRLTTFAEEAFNRRRDL